MERRFTMNDFEQSLKENADEFKMIPSKRVWHGIYNDLHPGRRWPSITMGFLLVFSLLFVGYLNTNNGSQEKMNKKIIASAGAIKNRSTSLPVLKNNLEFSPFKNGLNEKSSIPDNEERIDNKSNSELKTHPEERSILLNDDPNAQGPMLLHNLQQIIFDNDMVVSLKKEIFSGPAILNNLNAKGNSELENSISDLSGVNYQNIQQAIPINDFADILPFVQNNSIYNDLSIQKDASLIKKINIDNFVNKEGKIHKKATIPTRKQNARVNWIYYATPEISTVAFKGQSITQSSSVNFSSAITINQRNYHVLHYEAIGFESGAQFNYNFAKKLSLTTGLDISYSGYNIISNEVHPTFATLILRDPESGSEFSRSYISHYGDGTGQASVSLRNYSLQASIPVGLEYEFFGNGKVQFKVGADVAPSMVIKGNSYVLSSDGNNYINDPSLLRKWNMSSNFNLFVSFKSNKFKWQIGPNIRYQWLSTYRKDYSIQEHLIDYGIRIGISR